MEGKKVLLVAGASMAVHAAALAQLHSEPLTGDELRPIGNAWDSDSPPRRLSILTNSPDYHPSYMRVGVRFNGEERNDVQSYDADAGKLETIHRQKLEGTVEPYWRYAETRQQRRARQRWERSR